MIPNVIKVLLVEDDEDDYILAKSLLNNKAFELIWAQTISSALQCLRESAIDVVLLDLTIPDSRGLETFDKLRAYASAVPIILLTGLKDDKVGAEAVERGAQDYLVKGEITAALLERSLKYSVLRKKAEKDGRKIERLQEREDFVAAFTADLTSPMSEMGRILQSIANTATNNLTDEQTKLFAVFMEKNTSVQRILSHLLDVYRYEKKSDSFKLQTTDFSALAQDCVKELSNSAEYDGVQLKAELPSNKAIIFGNPEDLRRALIGVLESAFNATPASPGAVSVTVKYADDTAVFQVSSAAANSESRETAKDKSARRGDGGRQTSSLSMYLCRQIIKAHGGTLKSETSPDTKMTWTVTLPLNESVSPVGV